MRTTGSGSFSGWKHFEAWRASRQTAVQGYLSDGATYSSALAKAFMDNVSGQAKLATQAALKRLQAATKAKLDEAVALKVDKTA